MKTESIRKIVLATAAAALIAASQPSWITSTYAAESTAVATAKVVQVVINEEVQEFDQPAIMLDGNTMVPMRGIFEKLGATIKWDNATRTVTGTKGTTTVVLQIGSKTAKVNGKTVTLTAPATIVNGSTMVPLRFVSESLGADVKWDAGTYTATITQKTPVPSSSNTQPLSEDEKDAQRDNAILSDLKMATKVLNDAYDTGELTPQMYDNMTSLLTTILPRLVLGEWAGGNWVELNAVFENTDMVLKKEVPNGSETLLQKRQESIKYLTSIRNFLAPSGRYSKLVPREEQTLTNIKTKYGNHTYAVANQTEYDFVMKKVEDALKGVSSLSFNFADKELTKHFSNYLDGKDKKENYQRKEVAYGYLATAEQTMKALKDAGVPRDTITKAVNVGLIASSLMKDFTNPENLPAVSLYDLLGRGLNSSNTRAYTLSAVFDAAGFNTSIIRAPEYGLFFVVELGSKWYEYSFGNFEVYNKQDAEARGFKTELISTFGTPVK
ncbi:copper amine oxidase N-terminal domain-containing protein [Paenibacillaceae bacterium WGS1546]|uniref:copper amine oxidase N-terminal domain-containing protein n=1 Tax=Cohnella sp. WGS1546 TaxID=3366810 RepID=UPI00372D6CF8